LSSRTSVRSIAIVGVAFNAGIALDQIVGHARGAAGPTTAQLVNAAALEPLTSAVRRLGSDLSVSYALLQYSCAYPRI
jgi:hypothetical protein